MANGNVQYFDLEPVEVTDFSGKTREVLELINQHIIDGQQLDEVMQFLFESTRGLYPCDRIGLAFIEDFGDRVTAHWAISDYEPLALRSGYSERLMGSSLEKVISQKKLRIINDLKQYLEDHPQSRSSKLLLKEGVMSSMTCPLYVENRPIAILFRSSRQASVYNQDQVRMHLALAERIGLSVERAYRQEQYLRLRDSYFSLLEFLTSDVDPVVASILMDSDKLLGNCSGPKEKFLETIARGLGKKGLRLRNQLRDYCDLARIEMGEMEAMLDDAADLLVDIVSPAVTAIETSIKDKEIDFELSPPSGATIVQCDPRLMRIAVGHLLSNAVKYGKSKGKVQVSFETYPRSFAISVFNEGEGFTEDEEMYLFRKFNRLSGSTLGQSEGTGVGLYVAWRVVRAHGGQITAESEPGRWAKFVVTVPQPTVSAFKKNSNF